MEKVKCSQCGNTFSVKATPPDKMVMILPSGERKLVKEVFEGCEGELVTYCPYCKEDRYVEFLEEGGK